MPWFTINGIELAGIAAIASPPAGDRRDIGSQTEAGDGSLIITRQTRKRDLKFGTVPLGRADAYAWEGLLAGESAVWSFDTEFGFYSSKGDPGDGVGVVQGTTKKYGTAALQVDGGEAWFTTGMGLVAPWTVALWARPSTDPWVHYVLRSDGAKWVDGTRNDAFGIDSLLEVAAGDVVLTNQAPVNAEYFDDLVVSPFLWLDTWPAQVFAAGQPFGPAPYLTAAGNLVPEATTRRMGLVSMSEKVIVANRGSGLEHDVRQLEFQLKGA